MIGFARIFDVGWSAAMLVLFSTAVHMCKGATLAIVPFVLPESIGSVVGIVAAGGKACS